MKSTRFKVHASIRLPTKLQQQRLHRVIREVLTPLQRYTLTSYYFRELTLAEIARERQVNKSTVCRTLQRAEKKLQQYLQY
jgi:RNA polymerase sigma factor (sigma-70 family)